jgi:hypothetical protein
VTRRFQIPCGSAFIAVLTQGLGVFVLILRG